MNEPRPQSEEKVTRAEAQSWVDIAVREQQERYRSLFDEYSRINKEREKYREALEKLCVKGRCPIAEEALGI